MLFEPVKGKMRVCVCVCVFFDMLCFEDRDVQFTCKVRTLLGGEDSLLWSSAQELKFQVRVRFPSKE